MASLKEVKNRINSVKSTRKITSAMKMVASAKLHKAQGAIGNMLPYQRKLNKILSNFLSADLPIVSPYVKVREVERVAVLAFSSNTSLCGAFNANVIKRMSQTIDKYSHVEHDNIRVFAIGKKVEDAAKRLGFQPVEVSQTLADKPSYEEAADLAQRLMAMYAAGEIDRVELIYHHFKSMSSQILVGETYLPIDLTRSTEESSQGEGDGEVVNDYIVEPSVSELISALIPTVLSQKLFTAALDSNASEHAARTLAMQVATDNADELIQDLTKQYNKSRQQAITNELLDIVGGSMQ